ncbi:MAG: hypothetical protein JWN88_645 [Frankiales bacterium]|jgi:hypothetical protein|nr:hypothetical protein [Frankiales bacterium]
MTETLQRPSRPSPAPRRTAADARRELRLAGVAAAVQAAGLGLLLLAVPVLLVWATDPRAGSGAGSALRTVGQLWLVAHGAALEIPGGRWTLTPLALVAVPVLLLGGAARRTSGARPATALRDVVRLAGTAALTNALLAGAVAAVSGTEDVHPGLISSVVGACVLAFLATAAGALRGDRLWRAAWLRLPQRGRRFTRLAAIVSGVLAAGGALLAGLSFAVHAGRAADLAAISDPGPVGGLALLALGISLVPNAVLWSCAWLVGPGFAVGVGTAVGPLGHELGPVPAFPLLAALPGSGLPGWWGLLALAVPVCAGVLAGRVVHRELRDVSTARACAEAALVGPVVGLVWASLAWLSGGSAGGERLAQLGPAPWAVGLALAAEVGLAAVASVALHRRGRLRRGGSAT